MIFDHIRYDETEDFYGNSVVLHLAKNRLKEADLSSHEAEYFIDIHKNDFEISENKIIINDNKLYDKKKKLIKNQMHTINTILHKFTVDEVLQFKENYIFYFGNGYLIVTSDEDKNSTDIILTPNAWVVKELLE